MKKATDSLLADHQMIRKLLGGFHVDSPRFAEIGKTLDRVVRLHAWYEDTIFIPVLRREPLFAARYLDELGTEHKDIDHLMGLVVQSGVTPSLALEATLRQFRAVLETHLTKEEDALFPLAEKILTSEGLNQISAEMDRRHPPAP